MVTLLLEILRTIINIVLGLRQKKLPLHDSTIKNGIDIRENPFQITPRDSFSSDPEKIYSKPTEHTKLKIVNAMRKESNFKIKKKASRTKTRRKRNKISIPDMSNENLKKSLIHIKHIPKTRKKAMTKKRKVKKRK